MTLARSVAACLLLSACAARAPTTTVTAVTPALAATPGPAILRAGDPAAPAVDERAPPPADLRSEVMGWAVLTDGAPLVLTR